MNNHEQTEKTSPNTENVCWGYAPENGPERWEHLAPEYRICGIGRHQSPIDIVDPTPATLPAIHFNYQPLAVNTHNTGRTIQVAYPEGSWITVDAVRYDLLQFHFHAPSEHTVAGKFSDMELHLVHKSGDGVLAVIGVLIEAGGINAALAPFWNSLPASPGESEQVKGVTFDLMDLLPRTKSTYRYIGSLTTPPCSEGVEWFVMTTPIEMSPSQIATFKAVMAANNRPTQPLNGRELCVDVPN